MKTLYLAGEGVESALGERAAFSLDDADGDEDVEGD